ncbi:MAG TPA: EF-hand domain-containing protein [Allosphingosinicella sp.]|jgi:hypothetical protein
MLKILLTPLVGLAAAAAAPPPGPPPSPEPRGRVFLSPMGEPFRSRDAGADLVGAWFAAADTDRDGALGLAEMRADAARFFATLDTNGDGEIDPAELARYENDVAPEVQLGLQMHSRWGGGGGWSGGRHGGGDWGDGRRRQDGGRGRGEYDPGLEGAGRYAFLNIPEPVISADEDLNRGVSRAEFARAAGARFLMLDKDRDGRLTRAELPPPPERQERDKKRK